MRPQGHAGIGVLASKSRIDVSDAGTEGVVLLYTKEIRLAAKAHVGYDLSALVIRNHIGITLSFWAGDGLMVVVIQEVERRRIAPHDVEH